MDQTSLETTSLEGEVVENRNTITLEEADAGIRNGLKDAAQSVITVGYYLKAVRDNELFRSAGYETIWDYAWGEYGFSKGTASRYMKRNDRFSIGGNARSLQMSSGRLTGHSCRRCCPWMRSR